MNFRTQVNPKNSNNTFNNRNNMNFQQNPVVVRPFNNNNNYNNFNMNSMNNQSNNMNNFNQMNNINNLNNMNNMNIMSNNLNSMSYNRSNINNNNMNNNMNFINNNMNLMNSNMNNTNNPNMNSFNNMNNMNQMQISQSNQILNNNQGSSIRDNKLICIICSNRVTKPKSCPYCGVLSCYDCSKSYFASYEYCKNCRKRININEMLNQNLEENMITSTKSIKMNIGSVNKKQNLHKSLVMNINSQTDNNNFMNMFNNNNNNNINNNIINNNNNNIIFNNNNNNNNPNICPTHNNRIDYYCVHCDGYYCSNCLVFFGPGVKQHAGHFLVPISKMNDLNIKQVINEYKKLTQTNTNLENLLGVYNYKIRENYIKRNEFEYQLNKLKDSYMKKLDDSLQELDGVLNDLKTQKEKIENSFGSIPNGFNNIVNSNDHVQGGIITQELKKLNKYDQNLENSIKQLGKSDLKLYMENYHSQIIEIPIPYGGQYNEGLELYKQQQINFINNHNSALIIKYLQNKVYISFIIDINMPLNSIEFPKFYCYITIKNQKYGLEYEDLLTQSFPQDVIRHNIGNRNFQQINTNEFDYGQFIFLAGEEKKIKMQMFVMKIFYKK